MEILIRDLKTLLKNFELDHDPEPQKRVSDLLDQMARDVAEHEDILTLRVIIDHNLRRWSRAGDHLTKLIENINLLY